MLHQECVDRHAGTAPFRLALDDGRERYSFDDIAELSRRLATYLRDAEGIAPRARVAIVLPQRVETALLHIACSRIGAITVPLSPLFGPEGLAARLGDAAPELVVTLEKHGPALHEALALVESAAPTRFADDALFEARWTSSRQLDPADEVSVDENAPLTLIYTSGTTAKPKGVLLPHRVIAGRMPGFLAAHAPLGEDALFYSPADWSWIGGLHDSLFAPWHAGVGVLTHERHGALDVSAMYAMLTSRGATAAFFPPTAIKLLARAGDPPLRLRSVHSAGEPLPAPTASWAREHLTDRLSEVYGLTECAFLVGTAGPSVVPAGSMGRAFAGHGVRVIEHEICIERGSPTMMLGYWQGPDDAPRLPLDEQGFLHTGDLAREEDGWLFLLGRADDLIKTSGLRVGPAEVEACLLHHPDVAECAVVGVPDDARGQRVKAFVKRVAGRDVTADALMAFVKERLAAHAYPREIEFVDALPLTVSGKLRRRELRGP